MRIGLTASSFRRTTNGIRSRRIESYRRIHDWMRLAFAELKIETELAPCCKKSLPGQCFTGHEKFDLLWHGKKIAGAAQRRNKLGLLIQGSVQPPAVSIERGDWEQAMIAVARSAIWCSLANRRGRCTIADGGEPTGRWKIFAGGL